VKNPPWNKSSCGCDKILTKSVGSWWWPKFFNQTKPNQTLFFLSIGGNERFTGALQNMWVERQWNLDEPWNLLPSLSKSCLLNNNILRHPPITYLILCSLMIFLSHEVKCVHIACTLLLLLLLLLLLFNPHPNILLSVMHEFCFFWSCGWW